MSPFFIMINKKNGVPHRMTLLRIFGNENGYVQKIKNFVDSTIYQQRNFRHVKNILSVFIMQKYF